MSPDHSNDAVVSYLRERDSERRKNRRFWIILAIAAAVVGGTVYNVKHNLDEEHHRDEQRVQDIGCAMDRRLCD